MNSKIALFQFNAIIKIRMNNPIKIINQSLANPKSFWIGVFLTSCLLFIIIGTLFLGMDFTKATGSKYNNGGPLYLLILGGLPGLFLLAYGIKPKRKMGKIGAVLFKLYDLVFTWRR